MSASTFDNIVLAVTDAMGDDSAKAVTWAGRGVNYAQLVAAILFQPPELQKSTSLTLAASGESVSLSALTALRVIDSIYNITASRGMHPIEWSRWDVVKPVGAGNATVYCRRGTTLYTAPIPTSSNFLTMYYTDYPSVLTSGDTLSFSNLDPFIVSSAIKFAWAFQEEGESSTLFDKIEETLKLPFTLNAIQRKQLEEGVRNVQSNS